MDFTADELLAGPALAEHQDGVPGPRGALDVLVEGSHHGAPADESAEGLQLRERDARLRARAFLLGGAEPVELAEGRSEAGGVRLSGLEQVRGLEGQGRLVREGLQDRQVVLAEGLLGEAVIEVEGPRAARRGGLAGRR